MRFRPFAQIVKIGPLTPFSPWSSSFTRITMLINHLCYSSSDNQFKLVWNIILVYFLFFLAVGTAGSICTTDCDPLQKSPHIPKNVPEVWSIIMNDSWILKPLWHGERPASETLIKSQNLFLLWSSHLLHTVWTHFFWTKAMERERRIHETEAAHNFRDIKDLRRLMKVLSSFSFGLFLCWRGKPADGFAELSLSWFSRSILSLAL